MRRLICFFLIMLLVSFNVFAIGNEANIINLDFENSQADQLFTRDRQIGDINNDGDIDALDLSVLRKYMLGIESYNAEYLDINSDGSINLFDLVRLKKLVSAFVKLITYDADIKSNVMVVNGGVKYKEKFVDNLETNTYYQISYRYKTDSDKPLVLKLNGLSDEAIVLNGNVSSEWANEYFIVKTTANLISSVGNELEIEGSGRIDDFQIIKITDYWFNSNDLAQGGYDKFENGNK